MARRSKAVGKASQVKDRKANPTKGTKAATTMRRNAPAVTRRKRVSVAALEAQLRRRTEELDEARQQQTATADILKVIACSPDELQPVLDAIAKTSRELCGSDGVTIFLLRDEKLYFTAIAGGVPKHLEYLRANPAATDEPGSAFWQVLQKKCTVNYANVFDHPELDHNSVRLGGPRALLLVPLLRDSQILGIIVLRQSHLRPFTPPQVQAIEVFADQAVIAIENARLFEEVRKRTRELSESLRFQTATSEVLRVISRSPDRLQPVLDTIATTSHELCGCDAVSIVLLRDDTFHFVAVSGSLPKHVQHLRSNPAPLGDPGSVFTRVADQKRTLHYPNIADDPELMAGSTGLGGPRALLLVPLMQEDEFIGTIVLRQSHDKPFTPQQIQAVETFADQAVIAISNVNLFEEVQARTRDLTESLQQQTATADVLKVISASPAELDPVFQTMLENAVRLCEAKFAMLFLLEDDQYRAVEMWNLPAAYSDFLSRHPIRVDARIPLGRILDTKRPVQVDDVLADQSYIERHPGIVAVAELGGARTLLQVPMLKDDQIVGSIGIYRQEVRPFTDKQVALVQNFAAQAVIAIENARLLNELRQRTRELSKSLDDLRAAQDRLVQTEKLASLGQLTAGIAHEIKNPLNFVNNFSALSAELTDELNDALKPVAMDGKVREEVNELTALLKDNLEKVVQHGKRADSIVKNMLLHSREGSGEQRPSDINALLDESLNLAYHGARAEKPGFNITLHRDFDPVAGMADVYPQEITRVLLNLISNGFYAATRRAAEIGDGFEPALRAATKNRGDKVEIRIRDNGMGIAPDAKEKIFNPFFTTKPAGEGTGLGLSMSHDIVVKQHGGTIDVDTERGVFTEFIVTLPRTIAPRKTAGGTT
jgi:signal transduction histidine kinase